MQGIRKRLVTSYLLVIFLTVFILEALLLIGIRQYYVDNVKEIMRQQAEVTANFYNLYLAGSDLVREAPFLYDSFSQVTTAQVQIVDQQGVLLVASPGLDRGEQVNLPDVQRALAGEPGDWQGVLSPTNEPILAVTQPLKAGEQVVGAVRLLTSLTGVNEVIQRVALLLVTIGLAVLLLGAGVSMYLSSTITRPVERITGVALQMAKGRFNERAAKDYDDEIGKLADTLNYMAGEIARQDHLKNQFIASISHELRTPLTAIKGWAVTLRGSLENKAEMLAGLTIIEKESDRLTSLVEELLDFSKLAAGKITLARDLVNAGELLSSLAKMVTPRALRQGIHLVVDIQEEIPAIQADANRLKQVLINLLDNAFKFTPTGGSISITALSNNQALIIRVSDTGAGIAANHLPRVKERFYKASAHSGSGLGLAICDEIIKLHGGELTLASEGGQGTRAEVMLPL
ncbi:HAMP domain-containing protein [Desulforamulus aeronauticus DSM 10349]|uniref:histidine kinase n=1 Tax=Desulforamulus aeronauticus DSM 10349 TaxID=1121421 RepID=A0A1M6TEM1_9FIRM|nr:HAMP domain-containing protein [Desulforamulus aeronauticus DSM 10349]